MQATKRPKLEPADCRFYPKEKGYLLVEDWVVTANDGKEYFIPEGFWFNGGSIPPAFWQVTFTPFDPHIIDGFLLHDWAYTSHVMDKQTADDSLQDWIDKKGNGVKGALVASAVRMFGKSSWKHVGIDMLYLHDLKNQIINRGIRLDRYRL